MCSLFGKVDSDEQIDLYKQTTALKTKFLLGRLGSISLINLIFLTIFLDRLEFKLYAALLMLSLMIIIITCAIKDKFALLNLFLIPFAIPAIAILNGGMLLIVFNATVLALTVFFLAFFH